MIDYWNSRLALLRESPVVDIYGVITLGIDGPWLHEEPDTYMSQFFMDAWRVGHGEIQITQLRIMIFGPQIEVQKVVGIEELQYNRGVIHIKARLVQDEYQHALLVEWVGLVISDAELNEIHRLLDDPPLPAPPSPLLDQYQSITLTSWADFCPVSQPNYKRPDGIFQLIFDNEELPIIHWLYKNDALIPAQIAAYSYLVENDKAVRDAILQAIFERYPRWQEKISTLAGRVRYRPKYMPDVTHPSKFKSLISLWNVHIMTEAREGFAYVYLSLQPEWDIEHGLAAVVHKNRVIAVGNHDSMYNVEKEDAKKR